MRKMLALVLIMICLCSMTVQAEDTPQFETLYDWSSQWQGNYPDYMSGFWFDGENACIGVLDTEEGNRAKREIMKEVKENSNIIFVHHKYSHDELKEVESEILAYIDKNIENLGSWSVGISEDENVIRIRFGEEYKWNFKAHKAIRMFNKTYGDRVEIFLGDKALDNHGGFTSITTCVGIGVVILAVVFVIKQRKKR